MGHETAIGTATDLRTGELLDQVQGVFAAKGFEKASMQDLAQAANMSAGNFYRYFPSKDAIIEALVQRVLSALEARFLSIMTATDPLAALRETLDGRMNPDVCEESALWSEIVAVANRRADVGAMIGRLEETLTGYLVTVFGRVAGLDTGAAHERFHAHATLIFMLIQGIKMRRRDGAAEFSRLRALALRVIDDLLDDISRAAAPATLQTGSL